MLDEDALGAIATSANGDLRSAFNSLDLAVLSTSENTGASAAITLDRGKRLQRSYITMDRWRRPRCALCPTKSLSVPDVDASLPYAARLIEAGDLPS